MKSAGNNDQTAASRDPWRDIEAFRKRLDRLGINPRTVKAFRQIIWSYYLQHGREFSWRNTKDPYRILVSEIMLQQTQTSRAAQKFDDFIARFPDFQTLASAPLRDVLDAWQGLGYNRRAIALHRIALEVAASGGSLPGSVRELLSLPGIGPYTASAVAAIAFDRPVAFVETNIRTVYVAFFSASNDAEIIQLVGRTLDRSNPRKWYYALFDYGAMLKKANRGRGPLHARRRVQAKFEGSHRQLRGRVLKALLAQGPATADRLGESLGQRPEVILKVFEELANEGFIELQGRKARVANTRLEERKWLPDLDSNQGPSG